MSFLISPPHWIDERTKASTKFSLSIKHTFKSLSNNPQNSILAIFASYPKDKEYNPLSE